MKHLKIHKFPFKKVIVLDIECKCTLHFKTDHGLRREEKVEFLELKHVKVARLDFLRGYLPSLSISYVAMSKDMEKRLPQLYYIKMKISNNLGFIAIGVVMAT